MQTPGSHILHKRNPTLHASDEVDTVVDYLRAGGESIPNHPADRISAYLGFLSTEVNYGILTGDPDSIARVVASHVIKPEDVPEGYFDLQRRIAREQGHGDIDISPEMRREAARVIGADQRSSLFPWAKYLSSNADYPDWFRLYAFDGVTQLGKFDKTKDEFQRRSNFTATPFPELSRGALSQVYSWLKEAHVDGQKITDIFEDPRREAAFQKALASGNFAKLYVHAIHKTQDGMITPEQREKLEGSWKQYVQNSDPEVLHGDLQGFGLDWCTATGFETTKMHLAGGDFYVYRTPGKDGKDAVPRIAIRMQNGQVAEVRGINPGQELEPELIDIATAKVETLPGGERYTQIAADMKRVTALEAKVTAGGNLDDDDLVFLYGFDHRIQGFGYDDDPRVWDLVNGRDAAAEIIYLGGKHTDLPRARGLVEAAKNSQRLRAIETMMIHGEEPDAMDLAFLYQVADPTHSRPVLKYTGYPMDWELIAKRSTIDDLIKVYSDPMGHQQYDPDGVKLKQMQLLQDAASEHPSIAGLRVLYLDPIDTRNDAVFSAREEIKRKRHYGNDYVRIQEAERDYAKAIYAKQMAGEELSLDELRFMYQVDAPTRAQRYIHQVIDTILERDVAHDFEVLLANSPGVTSEQQYHNERKAAAAETIVRLYKKHQSDDPLTNEEIDTLRQIRAMSTLNPTIEPLLDGMLSYFEHPTPRLLR